MSKNLHFRKNQHFRSTVAPTLFGELPEGLREVLLASAPIKSFSDGQIIQHKGDRPDGFWIINEGVVKVGQFRLDGEFRTIALLSEGDSFGELAMFATNRRAVDSVAEGAAKLHWIKASTFDAAISADPSAMRSLIGALAAQLQETINVVASLGAGTSKARIAAVLVNLASTGEDALIIKLGQQDLAELTGLTRATVNKCLSELEASGALVRLYGKLEILDREILRSAAFS